MKQRGGALQDWCRARFGGTRDPWRSPVPGVSFRANTAGGREGAAGLVAGGAWRYERIGDRRCQAFHFARTRRCGELGDNSGGYAARRGWRRNATPGTRAPRGARRGSSGPARRRAQARHRLICRRSPRRGVGGMLLLVPRAKGGRGTGGGRAGGRKPGPSLRAAIRPERAGTERATEGGETRALRAQRARSEPGGAPPEGVLSSVARAGLASALLRGQAGGRGAAGASARLGARGHQSSAAGDEHPEPLGRRAHSHRKVPGGIAVELVRDVLAAGEGDLLAGEALDALHP